MDELAKAYFKKFLIRTEILPEYHKRQAYSDVIRESQEALELFIKGLLRVIGAEPSHTHDPGKELHVVSARVPGPFQPHTENLVRWSKLLRKERELSFYGAADFIPTEEYEEGEARRALEFLQEIAAVLKGWQG